MCLMPKPAFSLTVKFPWNRQGTSSLSPRDRGGMARRPGAQSQPQNNMGTWDVAVVLSAKRTAQSAGTGGA